MHKLFRSYGSTGRKLLGAALLTAATSVQTPAAPGPGTSEKDITLTLLGSFASGVFNAAGSEISAYDPHTHRLFITNVAAGAIDIVDIGNPAAPVKVRSVSLAPYGLQTNSVAVHNGIVAAAVQASVKTDPGRVVFFDTDGAPLSAVTVGALPDMVTFTPDGKRVLVANEGEPNDAYTIDPEGSVSIIDLHGGAASVTQADVVTAGFTGFNNAALDPSIRIFGPGATVAQDLEPEYITVSDDGQTAWVTLQEANAIGELDIRNGIFIRLIGLGFKDHSLAGNGFDASDRDGPSNTGRINIANWPVFGMYQPDGIASYRVEGRTYLVTANEGDTRAYSGFNEEVRVSALNLDPTALPNATALKGNAQLGRLTVSTVLSDTDKDNDVDRLYLFGARSFSIWTADGVPVFDSGDDFEQTTARLLPAEFNDLESSFRRSSGETSSNAT
jgi:hypothetical protein